MPFLLAAAGVAAGLQADGPAPVDGPGPSNCVEEAAAEAPSPLWLHPLTMAQHAENTEPVARVGAEGSWEARQGRG